MTRAKELSLMSSFITGNDNFITQFGKIWGKNGKNFEKIWENM